MKSAVLRYWPVSVATLAIGIVLTLTLMPYGMRPSVLFHLGAIQERSHPLPEGFVVLDVPSYDGAQYYGIARNMPLIARPSRWDQLQHLNPTSYAYQRFLLPKTAWILALGQTTWLPFSFLLINIASLIGAAYIFWRSTKSSLGTFALVFSPAAMVGLHFTLAEPLTILLITLFLTRFMRNREQLEWLDVVLLALLPLSREVNVLFCGLLWLYLLWRRKWTSAAWAMIPFLTFFLLHGWIYAVFNELPFLMSADKRTLPFEAMLTLIFGGYGINRLTLTSIPLALFVVIPGLLWTGWLIVKNRDRSFVAIGSFVFLLLMTTMPDHIWGSITSIGRVITPVDPLLLLTATRNKSRMSLWLTAMILVIGLGAGLSLASVIHPFHPA
jgi:hypothetical protein